MKKLIFTSSLLVLLCLHTATTGSTNSIGEDNNQKGIASSAATEYEKAVKMLKEAKLTSFSDIFIAPNIESSLEDTDVILKNYYAMVSRKRRELMFPRANCAPACPALFDCVDFTEIGSSTTTVTNLGVETSYSTVSSSCVATGTCEPTACSDVTVLSCGGTCTPAFTSLEADIAFTTYLTTEYSDGAFFSGISTTTTDITTYTSTSTNICTCSVTTSSSSTTTSTSSSSTATNTATNTLLSAANAAAAVAPVLTGAVLGGLSIWALIEAITLSNQRQEEIQNNLELFDQFFTNQQQQLGQIQELQQVQQQQQQQMLQLQQQLSSGNLGFLNGFDNEGNSFGFLNQGGGGLNSLEIGGAAGSQQSTTGGFTATGIGGPSGSQQSATGGFTAAGIGGAAGSQQSTTGGFTATGIGGAAGSQQSTTGGFTAAGIGGASGSQQSATGGFTAAGIGGTAGSQQSATGGFNATGIGGPSGSQQSATGGFTATGIGGAAGSQQSTTGGFTAAGIGGPSGSQQSATGGFTATGIGGATGSQQSTTGGFTATGIGGAAGSQQSTTGGFTAAGIGGPSGSQQSATGGFTGAGIGGASGSQQSTTGGFTATGIGGATGSKQSTTGGFNVAGIGGGIQYQPFSGSYNSFVKENEKIKESVEQQEISKTPINTLSIPVMGSHSIVTFDGCGDSSIRMTEDGKCHPLLRQGPCSNPRFWLTIDPISLKGQCTPRLCGRNRVFVRRDGLCHDASDAAGECGGKGRRLFYTAFGDPICDCPLGQFPFPGPYDPCYKLFTRGPCPPGHVLLFNRKTGALECSLPSPGSCHHKQSNDGQQQQIPIVTLDDGSCHIFSSSLSNDGPCDDVKGLTFKSTKRRQFNDSFATYLSPPDKNNRTAGVLFLLGYDVFKRHFKCYNVAKLRSTRKEEADLDALFDPLSLSAYWKHSTLIDDYSLPDQLLNPCRPGSRSGINFKCANPILRSSSLSAELHSENSKIPHRPAWVCSGSQVLQANGQCVSSRGAN